MYNFRLDWITSTWITSHQKCIYFIWFNFTFPVNIKIEQSHAQFSSHATALCWWILPLLLLLLLSIISAFLLFFWFLHSNRNNIIWWKALVIGNLIRNHLLAVTMKRWYETGIALKPINFSLRWPCFRYENSRFPMNCFISILVLRETQKKNDFFN